MQLKWERPDNRFFPHSLLSLCTIVNSQSILINIWLTDQQCQQTKQQNYNPPTIQTAELQWNSAEEAQNLIYQHL